MAKQESTKLKVKWRVTGFPLIVITPDMIVYQLPHESKGREYPIRKVSPTIHMKKNYYRIGKKRCSEEKLHALCYESEETLSLNDPTVTTLPFSKKLKK